MKSKNPWKLQITEPLRMTTQDGYEVQLLLSCYVNGRIYLKDLKGVKTVLPKLIKVIKKQMLDEAEKHRTKVKTTIIKY